MSQSLIKSQDGNLENPEGGGRFLESNHFKCVLLFVSFAFFSLLSPVAEATNICQPRSPGSGFASG